MTKIKVSRKDFMRNINRLVDTEQSFSSHPHNIQKPFFGEITEQSFKIKDTPSLLYRDATIVILGKFQNDKLEVSTKPNNLILSIILVILLFSLTVIFLATDNKNFAVIGLVIIAFSMIYIILPYIINKSKFQRFLTEISNNKGN